MPISAQDFFGSPITPAKREAPWSLASTTPQKPVKLPEGSLLPPDADMRAGLEEAASRHKINPALLMALAQQESTYNPSAVGVPTKWGRASGMFQFLDSTAKGHGIDPLDWKQSADAAAKDLAEQIAKKGIDWAIAHHHGGPNPKQHGPKTRQYAREVLAKAQVIAKELGITIDVPDEQNPDFSNVVGTPTPDADSFFGTAPVKGEKKGAATVEGEQEPEGLFDTAKRLYGKGSMQEAFEDIDILAPVRRTVARGWEGIQDFINRETVEVERTDEELRRIWDANPSFVAAEKSGTPGITFAEWAKQNRKAAVTAQTAEEDEAKWTQRLAANPEDAYLLPKRLSHLRPQADDSRFADKHSFTGFMQRVIANHKNPLDLMLQDSIPANIVTGLFNLPEQERKKFDQARQITQALEVTNNPEGKSAEEVEQAKQVVGDWKKKTDKTIVESWQELYQAAKDDPAAMAIGFSEALIADPELLLAPVGVGLKPIRAAQAARTAATGVRTTSIARRAAKIADRVLDAAGTTAAVNVAAGAASNFATEGEVNTDEVKMNAAIGVLFGGTVGALFAKGARAKAVDLDKAKLQGTYEDIIRDRAEADVELESQVRKTFEAETPEEAAVVGSALNRAEWERSQRFAELMGIRNSKDQAAWIAQRRKEVKATFRNESDYADYQRFVAKERVRRSEELAASAEARRREAAEAAQASVEDLAAKRQRLSDEFDQAIIARNEAEAAGEVDSAMQAAKAEDAARETAEQLNAEELYYAQLSQDAPTIRQVENKIARRDSQLRRPKWQRGEVDPQTLAAIGVGAASVTAIAMLPDDTQKTLLHSAILGGLSLYGLSKAKGSVGRLGLSSKSLQRGEIKFLSSSEVLNNARKGKFIDRDLGDKTITHPATFSTRFYPIFANIADKFKAKVVLDPFGGVGTIGKIKEFGYKGKVIANELESEWASQHKTHGVDESLVGDARKMKSIDTDSVDMIITSPAYGNALAYPRLKGKVKELTYANAIGRELTSGNAGRMVWGDAYRKLHVEAYEEFYRVTKPGGMAVINMKDFISKGDVVPVSNFHIKAMKDAGFKLKEHVKVATPGLQQGGVKRATVGHEDILIFQKPVKKSFRNQAGEIDPQLLARTGVVAGGAAAGFALFPEDQKLQGTLLGGLAGLLAPAGGSVLSRLRQSGAIAGDGQIIAAMVKAGKLANKLDEVELKARDSAWVERVRTGDQKAFQNLYETYFPKIKRFANKYMSNRESATGLDGEDIAQTAFAKVYQKLVDEPDFEIDNFPAFVTMVAENEALQALRKSQSQREGANVINESTVRRFDDEGNELSGRSVMDTTTGITDEGKMIISGVGESAEHAAQVAEFTDILRQAFDGMSKNMQDAMTAVHFENFTPEEAAKQLGLTYDNVRQLLSRGETLVRRSIEENRRKFGEPVVPRSQRGSADVGTMQKTALITAAATAGGTAGYFLYDGDPWKTAVLGGMGAAAVALTRGKGLTKALRGIDYRMRDFGPTLYGLAKKHGYQELKDIRKYNNETADFITQFGALPEKVKPVLIRALSTRDKVVINKMLEHVGGKKFVEAFDKVRKTLDEIEDQLVGYGLIKKSEKDYFPFRVKDLEGLRSALGKEAATEIEAALKNAERKAQETMGRPLNEIERGVVINKILEPYLGKTLHSTMPGFAKARTIQEIPERLQKFYFDPIETLNSYGVQAVKYIERAKFFGRNLVKRKEGTQEFVDIDKSVGQLVDDLRTKGEINDQQAFELAEILRDRFGGGERTPHPYIQGMKNLVNASLLGHISSAATQLGDLALQGLLHGPRSSAKALFRQIFRKKQLDLSDFGLNEHVAHEFLSDNWTRKVSDWSFKWGGFRAIDAIGKNFGLNATVDKMMRLAKTVEGERKLADLYQRYFPEDYSKALTALKKGQINESVELLAFTDLTQTQPLTQWELPQYYHKFPNGRVLYHLQTFSIRVMNMVYERSVKDLVSGDKKRFAKGARNLIAIGAVLGVQGVGTDKIKDMIAGRPVELKPEDVPVNALEALGMSMYDYNRIADSGPLKGLIDSKLPPIIRISYDLLNEPERAIKNVPVVGRLIYDRNREAFEDRRRKRRKEQGYKMEITVKPASEKKDSSGGGRRD